MRERVALSNTGLIISWVKGHRCPFTIAACTESRRVLITLLGSGAPVTAVPDTIMLAPAYEKTHFLEPTLYSK